MENLAKNFLWPKGVGHVLLAAHRFFLTGTYSLSPHLSWLFLPGPFRDLHSPHQSAPSGSAAVNTQVSFPRYFPISHSHTYPLPARQAVLTSQAGPAGPLWAPDPWTFTSPAWILFGHNSLCLSPLWLWVPEGRILYTQPSLPPCISRIQSRTRPRIGQKDW
jgi:hypothetical protein